MTKLPENEESSFPLFLNRPKSTSFGIELYRSAWPASLTEVRDDLKLKGFLKRAVEKDFAPEALVESIRARIRR